MEIICLNWYNLTLQVLKDEDGIFKMIPTDDASIYKNCLANKAEEIIRYFSC